MPLPQRARSRLFALGLTVLWLLPGCGKSGVDIGKDSPAPTNASPATADAPAPPAGPGPGEKTCFRCSGTGLVACTAPGCQNGKTDCPGACLRLNRGTWVHLDVPGHKPDELWQKYPNTGGKKGYMAFNYHHVGDVIAYRNGVAEDTGPCKICVGTTKVDCKVCKGQGQQPCEVCQGRKFIPVAWTPGDNPWLNSQPDLIRLRDGRLLFGKIVTTSGDDQTVHTRDNKWLHISAADVLTYSGTNR